MESIEWAHARTAHPQVFGPFETLGDNQCAADGFEDENSITLGIEGCAIFGTKEEILDLLAAASSAVEAFVLPENPMRNRLEALVKETIDDLETGLQREEAEVFFSENRAVIIVPGEEGLYSGRVITIYSDGNKLAADTGTWGNW